MAARFAVGAYDRGLTTLVWDSEAAELSLAGVDDRIRNASWGVRGGDGRFWFVDEAAGRVAGYELVDDGWRACGEANSGGGAPCFLDVDDQAGLIAVANYEGGEVALLRPEADDRLALVSVGHDRGSGPDAERQEGPHAHCVRLRGGRLYNTDLGSDQILMRPVCGGRLGPPTAVFDAPPGEGPRHLVFHPRLPLAYLLTELGSRLFALEVEADGRLVPRKSLSTLPAGFKGESLGGHLALSPDGGRLMISNRGHDSLVSFSLDEAGLPELEGFAPTQGRSPRFFLTAEELGIVLVAHEKAGGVVALAYSDGEVGQRLATAAIDKAAWVGRL